MSQPQHPQTTPADDLSDPSLYLNRELSLLEFHQRVLEQARDPTTPLLERVRFLSICSTNLDEFFEIRVSGLLQQIAYRLPRQEPDGMTAQETLSRVTEVARKLVTEQYRLLNDVLLPELEREGIRVVKRADWSEDQQRWIKRYFRTEVLPVLTPVGLDPAHPFPRVLNKALNFAVSVEGRDAFGRDSGTAVVQVPRSLPRLIRLPKRVAGAAHDLVLLSSIIHAHVQDSFPGMTVTGCYQFRVTRNSDLWVDEEDIDDLMRALKGELSTRNYGSAVRLEVVDSCPDEMVKFLLDNFDLTAGHLYRVNGPVNLHRLAALHEQVERPDLKYPPFAPRVPRRLEGGTADLFEVIRRGDVLLHHPYDTFVPVVDLVRKAAVDPHVLAIKMTLYRTGADSPLVEALIEAARASKEVTAVVELRARFDEAANIGLATRLQQAGAIVSYGVVGYKTHAKMLLIVRREGRRLQRYVHLGTGNYHTITTRSYTDVGLLTCDRALTEDVHRLFLQLTGLGEVVRLRKLVQSPFHLLDALVARIDDERRHAKHGRPARIVARMNSLSEPAIIRALYRASHAGVKIDLIVRGICCLRPGVPGVSENIRVRSIVGRFLEHSRVFAFGCDGREVVWCSSADWMQRNLHRRIETCFPIEDGRLARRVKDECLDTYLADDTQAWVLQADGSYRRLRPNKPVGTPAQVVLLERLCGQQMPVPVKRGKGKRKTGKASSEKTRLRETGPRFVGDGSADQTF